MGCVRQSVLYFGKGTRRQEFQQNRQMIGQFRGIGLKPAIPIGLNQGDHGTATIPAFAVNVLKQVEAERAGAVKEHHVFLFEIVDVVIPQGVHQGAQPAPRCCGEAAIRGKHAPDFRHSALKLPSGVAQEQGNRF